MNNERDFITQMLQGILDTVQGGRFVDDPQEVCDMLSDIHNKNEEERFHIHLEPRDIPRTVERMKSGDVRFKPLSLEGDVRIAVHERIKDSIAIREEIANEQLIAIRKAMPEDFLSVDEQCARMTTAYPEIDFNNLPLNIQAIRDDVARIGLMGVYGGKNYPNDPDMKQMLSEEFVTELKRVLALREAINTLEKGVVCDA